MTDLIKNIGAISIEDFNYELEEKKIAKYPLEKRDASKLLLWNDGEISDRQFSDISSLLPSGSLLVFNNTKVIKARLHFRKETGAKIEIFLLEPHTPSDYNLNFTQTESCSWDCTVGNLKKWREGKLKQTLLIENQEIDLFADNTENRGNICTIKFSWNNPNISFSEIINHAGIIPIPPYLHRNSEESDVTRYQTVYSKIEGSVAAPTAGLHFTDEIFEKIKKRKIKVAETTLHVGAGTFLPVKTESLASHEMHTEQLVIESGFVEMLSKQKGKVIAVGTTSARTLESLYYIGIEILKNPAIDPNKIKIDQWRPYREDENAITFKDSMKHLMKYLKHNNISRLYSSTQIIIVPGYEFKAISGLITNFHQPKSTLLLLISAFVGDDWNRIYAHALKNNYRFLSYGDSNLYLK
jgi:S-adenosylmethionine:tRNA ribosyltransferase-isomerase